jgi:hypothetical protein
MIDTLFVYECDQCGDRFTVARAGVSEPEPSWGASLCGRTTQHGEPCRGHVHLVESRAIGLPKTEHSE